jgi:hypothetical protein
MRSKLFKPLGLNNSQVSHVDVGGVNDFCEDDPANICKIIDFAVESLLFVMHFSVFYH